MSNIEIPPYDPLVPDDVQPTPQQPKKKSSALTGFLVFLAIVIVLAAGGAGAYWYLTQTQADNSELMAYEMLEGCEDLAEYENFLELYPESPRARDVKERYEELKDMYDQWRDVSFSDCVRDYTLFAKNYPNSSLARICDVKIDSLDWLEAKEKGGQEAIEEYLKKHPSGRYAGEASEAHSKIMDATPTTEEKLLIEETLRGFYRAFGDNDVESVYQLITPVMTRFLQKEGATKADVSDIIDRTYNEHILACKFVLNNDSRVKKVNTAEGEPIYKVSFSVDQHIERDNEGKTFGSYTAEATVNAQFKISSLTMTEVSRR